MERKTPLYDCHIKYGGKIVPFAGYLLPVQYGTGVIKEHMAVRENAGMFDVSHMGELVISGSDALDNINNLLTNDFSGMDDGQIRYSPMCNESGGIVDDMIVYQYTDNKYMMVVNAANRTKDRQWIEAHLFGDAILEDISDDISQIAVQGPNSYEIIAKLTDAIPQKYYTFLDNISIGGINCMVSQTGYTGEKGYEIYLANGDAAKMWELLLKTGKDLGLIPCGLGARDTLRFEASMPLYGHEMSDTINPLEVGLNFAVKLKKDKFIGKEALETKPIIRKRVGIEGIGRGIIREESPVFIGDKQIGITTSGTHCPYLEKALAMALIEAPYAIADTKVEIEVRGRKIEAKIIDLPFIKK